ncbi:MAG: hypothetical protein A2784_03215 [Candidatus Chisholmbacteria bacterium RIFCSPHIGHO2_01_FULL_48_12]|uniref:Methyltransferase type 11 domain-containing protein n=1 Tax=Candidatus Chisholmbacteria bacterium RIFCSPHIGHO2_01_FULL_48_12 TaxID=1797589 RepID=A0A1G1VJU0_9BACT|nr:MAG: hypothetical protein A2784_03215 [Candidatus Chisholmbacteria bacterium RIFCSPHIGHO2_01_FULL_48_12]
MIKIITQVTSLLIVRLLKKLEWGSALACRLTYWTGKAPVPTHPKHLVDFGQLYYLRHLKPTDRVLDLGCHAGEHAFKAAPYVKQVTGVDINLLPHGRCPRNVKFLTGDLEKKLPFASHQFTKVFFFAVLEHIRRRDQLLAEIHRVLTPNGQLFISVPNKNTAWKKLQRSVGLTGFADPDHKLEFSRTQIINLLKSHHFQDIKVQTTAFDTPLSGLIDLAGGFSLNLYKRLMRWKINQGKKYPANTVGFLITATNG